MPIQFYYYTMLLCCGAVLSPVRSLPVDPVLNVQGLLDASVRDSFNIPMYYPTVDEMREAIDESGSFLSTLR